MWVLRRALPTSAASPARHSFSPPCCPLRSAGKTSLAYAFAGRRDAAPGPTQKADFLFVDTAVDGAPASFSLWHCGGREEAAHLGPAFYSLADAFLVAYSPAGTAAQQEQHPTATLDYWADVCCGQVGEWGGHVESRKQTGRVPMLHCSAVLAAALVFIAAPLRLQSWKPAPFTRRPALLPAGPHSGLAAAGGCCQLAAGRRCRGAGGGGGGSRAVVPAARRRASLCCAGAGGCWRHPSSLLGAAACCSAAPRAAAPGAAACRRRCSGAWRHARSSGAQRARPGAAHPHAHQAAPHAAALRHGFQLEQ